MIVAYQKSCLNTESEVNTLSFCVNTKLLMPISSYFKDDFWSLEKGVVHKRYLFETKASLNDNVSSESLMLNNIGMLDTRIIDNR